jgi:spermidine synthase
MDEPFFRQLSRLLAPGGVLAVNYFGGKGPGLKRCWCRMRLVFDSGEV